jgi:hypothetical protein
MIAVAGAAMMKLSNPSAMSATTNFVIVIDHLPPLRRCAIGAVLCCRIEFYRHGNGIVADIELYDDNLILQSS